jgi:hypothetical protein
MTVPGKLEVTIKINRLPTEVATDKNGWKSFRISFGTRAALVRIRPRMWTRLEQAAAAHPAWVAVLTGQMGEDVQKGVFELLQPNLQVFEYKPREATASEGDGEGEKTAAEAAPEAPSGSE